jgi:hypothetical protein
VKFLIQAWKNQGLGLVKRMFVYLKTFPKGSVTVDTTHPNHSAYPNDDHSNWMEFYPDAEKEIPKVLPASKGPSVRMTVYVCSDYAHALVT